MKKKEKKGDDKKIAELEQKCGEYLSGWQRAQADYKNLKKEHAGQLTRITEIATVRFVEQLLPVIDHYEMAINHVPKDVEKESWMQGFFFIKKQFEAFLTETGVKRIETMGKQFDHNVHEAIGYEESDKEPDEIITEQQAGYLVGDIVIRHAKVIVSK